MGAPTADQFASLVQRLEAVTSRLEIMDVDAKPAAAAAGDDTSASVQAYDALLASEVASYVSCASRLDAPDVFSQAELVERAFTAMRDLVVLASKCKKPTDAEFGELLQPIAQLIMQVQGKTDRRSACFNHLQAMSEAIPALGWVQVDKTPAPHVNEMWQCGEFYANKILTSQKGIASHLEFVKSMKALFHALAACIKAHHTTGIAWSPSGNTVAEYKAGATARAPPTPKVGGVPPPPPPSDAAASASSGGMDAVFAQLSKGEAVTSGLKHVKKGEGIKDRPVPVQKASAPKAAPKAAVSAAPKPPKCELSNTKWMVEHQMKNTSLVITPDEVKQTVYVYGCSESLLQVKAKVNHITLDSCKKMSLVFDSAVAGVDLVNCTSCKVQVLSNVQTINIEKCSGTQLILNRDSLDAEVVSAKSSELNIIVPGATDEDEFKEHAIPEQFVSKYKDGKWSTEAMSHTG